MISCKYIPLWITLVKLWNMFVATILTIEFLSLQNGPKNATKWYPVLWIL